MFFLPPQPEPGEGLGLLNPGHRHQQTERLLVQVSLAPGPGQPVLKQSRPPTLHPAGLFASSAFQATTSASERNPQALTLFSFGTLCRWLWSAQTSVTPADPGPWANSGVRKWRRSSSNKVLFNYVTLSMIITLVLHSFCVCSRVKVHKCCIKMALNDFLAFTLL